MLHIHGQFEVERWTENFSGVFLLIFQSLLCEIRAFQMGLAMISEYHADTRFLMSLESMMGSHERKGTMGASEIILQRERLINAVLSTITDRCKKALFSCAVCYKMQANEISQLPAGWVHSLSYAWSTVARSSYSHGACTGSRIGCLVLFRTQNLYII